MCVLVLRRYWYGNGYCWSRETPRTESSGVANTNLCPDIFRRHTAWYTFIQNILSLFFVIFIVIINVLYVGMFAASSSDEAEVVAGYANALAAGK